MTVAADLATLAGAARRAAADAPFVETIEGERFLAHPPTPLLARAQTHLRAAVSAAAARAGLHLTLTDYEPLTVAGRYMVVPDLVVRERPDGPVVLVVELRSESTERYALGLKRLAYQTAGIDEYWFVEPRPSMRVQVLRLEERQRDYGWPPLALGPGDTLRPRRLPGLEVGVAALLPPPAPAP